VLRLRNSLAVLGFLSLPILGSPRRPPRRRPRAGTTSAAPIPARSPPRMEAFSSRAASISSTTSAARRLEGQVRDLRLPPERRRRDPGSALRLHVQPRAATRSCARSMSRTSVPGGLRVGEDRPGRGPRRQVLPQGGNPLGRLVLRNVSIQWPEAQSRLWVELVGSRPLAPDLALDYSLQFSPTTTR